MAMAADNIRDHDSITGDGYRFYARSSEKMPEIEDGSVALTVTSPPYWNAIDYDRHSADSTQWYRTREYSEGFVEYEEYLDFCERVFTETLRATKPGGFLAVVIGTVLWQKRHYPVPHDLTARLSRAGWEFHQDIIWHKTTAGVKRAGVTIQHPYPGYFYPNIMTEYILVFRKPGAPIYKSVNGAKEDSEFPIDRLFTNELANNVWHIAPVPPRTLDHPCPFPEEIPDRLVKLYSFVGDLVLDPFLGSGQTAKAAIANYRLAVGYDTVRQYVALSEIRVREPSKVRARQLVATFDKVDAPTSNKRVIEKIIKSESQRRLLETFGTYITAVDQ